MTPVAAVTLFLWAMGTGAIAGAIPALLCLVPAYIATRRRVAAEESAAIADERRRRIWRQEALEHEYWLRQCQLDRVAADVAAYRAWRVTQDGAA